MLFITPKIADILPLIDGVKTVRKRYKSIKMTYELRISSRYFKVVLGLELCGT